MPGDTRDNPGVIVFPPLILLAAIVLGLLLDYLLPLGVLAKLPHVPRLLAGLLLFLFGVSFPIRVSAQTSRPMRSSPPASSRMRAIPSISAVSSRFSASR
jgi:hypothetical protein